MISFFVAGNPQPRQSFRFALRGKHVHKYQPSNTPSAAWLKIVTREAELHAPDELLSGPLELRVTIYRRRPKSAKKSDLYPTQKPDDDNYTKPLRDRFNNVLWRDDSQVCHTDVWKLYTTNGREGAWIRVSRITEPPPEFEISI